METNAIDQLKTEQQTALEAMQHERDNAPKIYADLLDPDREPQPRDAEQLRAVMEVLELDLATVEQHADARHSAAGLGELEAELAELDAERTKASQHLIDAEAEHQAILMAWPEKFSKLLSRCSGLEAQVDRLQRERSRIHDLRRRHPLAFGDADQGAGDEK